MKKQRFYNINAINKLDCEYNIILGERSNGKSFAVKHKCVIDAWQDENKKFIYLRRWDLEIKTSMVEQYFADVNVEAITGGIGNCIQFYQRKIYISNRDDAGKTTKIKCIGYAMALTMEEHYTSGIYTDCKNIIYEEFISRNTYLANEPTKLQQIVSTIARRNRVKVWLIGNTISRICPYFSEWELINIPKQSQGTIDVYSHKTNQEDENGNTIIIKIAVEYAENSGNNSKMFFGNVSKMINSGLWQSEEKPHLPKKLKENYYIMHEIVFEQMGFKFFCQFLLDKETGFTAWFIQPKTSEIKKGTRIVSDVIYNSIYYTNSFVALSHGEQIAFNQLLHGVRYYSDNLTGADFETCLNKMLIKS